ncbi:MAG: hypothetical protein HC888_00810 [Candidatus Competibacteraceae bacterium]|nr:hypothetical protein [Candidatus Competibacteraceae bacterium]
MLPWEDEFDPPWMDKIKVPELQPVEAESLLTKLGDGVLGGLGVIGGILEKPSRAIRGGLNFAATGDLNSLREGFAWMPFSDSLSITDYKDRVSGKDLLSNFGIIDRQNDDPNSAFDSQDVAGFVAELLTDPLSFVGFGGATPLARPSPKLEVDCRQA